MRVAKKIGTLIAGIFLLAGSCGTIWAEEKNEDPKPYTTASVNFSSKYVSRGYELSKGSMVIQPSIAVGYEGFEASLWGNLDTDDHYIRTYKTNWNETDLTLSYAKDLGPVKLTGGYIYYSLDSAEDSMEVFLKIAANIMLTPTLSIYREIDNYQGWYLNLGISHSVNLTEAITLDLGASMGYQISDSDGIVEYNDLLVATTKKYKALHDGLISVGLTIPVGKYLAVKPMVAYSLPLSDDAENRIKGTSLSNDSDFFICSLNLTASF